MRRRKVFINERMVVLPSAMQRFHQYKINLSYRSDGTRMQELIQVPFVANFAMLVSLANV
jgi:hypothetical protein